jgi:hypothetical protein
MPCAAATSCVAPRSARWPPNAEVVARFRLIAAVVLMLRAGVDHGELSDLNILLGHPDGKHEVEVDGTTLHGDRTGSGVIGVGPPQAAPVMDTLQRNPGNAPLFRAWPADVRRHSAGVTNPIRNRHRMNTITSAALSKVSPEPRPMPPASPMREAAKDLSKALSGDDLSGARQAYVAVIKAAPEGAQWNPDGAFAQMGRALVQGNLPAAQEVAKGAMNDLRERLAVRPPAVQPVPAPPVETKAVPSSTGGLAGGRLDVVA